MCGRHESAGAATGCGSGFGKWGKYRGAMASGQWRRPKYNVPLNMVDHKDHYEVYVYAVGFDKENIRISVVDDMLYISGTRPVDENNLPEFTYQEYPIKSFERVVGLRKKVDTHHISARQENGVLIITLPKTPEAQQQAQDVKID